MSPESTTAGTLAIGDTITDERGQRYCAVFDVSVDQKVRVWTAYRDQERGVPDVVTYETDEPVFVVRSC